MLFRAVYVAYKESSPECMVGFYAPNGCEIQSYELPESFRKKYPRRVPAVRLGRLAVAREYQGQGVGELLLFHSMWNVAQVDAIVGAAALLVDAKDEAATRFYLKFGFLEFPDRSLNPFLPIARVREVVLQRKQ